MQPPHVTGFSKLSEFILLKAASGPDSEAHWQTASACCRGAPVTVTALSVTSRAAVASHGTAAAVTGSHAGRPTAAAEGECGRREAGGPGEATTGHRMTDSEPADAD